MHLQFLLFFFDFTTAAALNRVAWSIICNIWIPFDNENPTDGLNLVFLYFMQTWHLLSIVSIISNNSLSSMLQDFISFFNFSEVECPNWRCNLFATATFSLYDFYLDDSYLSLTKPNLSHWQRHNLNHSMLFYSVDYFRPNSHS